MKTPCIRLFAQNESGVNCVKFMPDTLNTIANGCEDASINLFDLRALGAVGTYTEANAFESVTALEFSKSGRILFSSDVNSIKAWDVLTTKKISKAGSDFKGEHKESIKSLSLSSDGTMLVSSSKNGVVHVWQ